MPWKLCLPTLKLRNHAGLALHSLTAEREYVQVSWHNTLHPLLEVFIVPAQISGGNRKRGTTRAKVGLLGARNREPRLCGALDVCTLRFGGRIAWNRAPRWSLMTNSGGRKLNRPDSPPARLHHFSKHPLNSQLDAQLDPPADIKDMLARWRSLFCNEPTVRDHSNQIRLALAAYAAGGEP